MTKVVVVGTGTRQKLRPRGKPFKKGERHAFQFKPGQSGNPGGKPKIHQRMRSEYDALLARIVPDEILESLGIPPGSTWAAAVALGVAGRAAAGDSNAAREMREATEGKVTERHEVVAKNDQPVQLPTLVIDFVESESG
jgi:hypothetical protein